MPAQPWRIFGIPLRVSASWFLVVAYLMWSLATGYFPVAYPRWSAAAHWALGSLAALLLFACIVIHELAHSLTAKRYGVPVASVTLFMFGGVSQLAGRPRRPFAELIIALAGPLMSVALAAACVVAGRSLRLAAPGFDVGSALLQYLALINIGLAIFNMLPAFPLDGGRVVRALLWGLTNDPVRATRMASWLGALFGLGLLVLGIWVAVAQHRLSAGVWYILLGWFLRDAALRSYRTGFG
ncbi:MAG: site-2 protease family protein [Candidatus Omnitrophica bacterium]|nr:site-2 protease family protein [Candidatus Omnitrophota bacterium]